MFQVETIPSPSEVTAFLLLDEGYGQNTSHLWPGRVGFMVHSNFVQVCTVLELLRIVLKSASPHTFTAGPFEISSKTFHFYFRRSRTQTDPSDALAPTLSPLAFQQTSKMPPVPL